MEPGSTATSELISPQMAPGQTSDFKGLYGMACSQRPVMGGPDLCGVNIPDYAQDIMGKLETVNKIKIENQVCCIDSCIFERMRNYQIYTNDGGSRDYLFSAQQFRRSICDDAYQLIYKQGDNIFGAFGYTLGCCCEGKCCCCCCGGAKAKCCDKCCDFSKCKNCCTCHCGLCDPKAYLDVRFTGNMKEVLSTNEGLYVGTVIEPCTPPCVHKLGYANVGGRYLLHESLFSPITNIFCGDALFCGHQLNIMDSKENDKIVGSVVIRKPLCPFWNLNLSFDVTFPSMANGLEKLMIISSVFMYEYIHGLMKSKKKEALVIRV